MYVSQQPGWTKHFGPHPTHSGGHQHCHNSIRSECDTCAHIITDKMCLFTRGQFWPSGIVVACVSLSVCVSVCVCVRQPRACPRNKSPRVQARTTKFGQKVQNNLVKVPIVLGGNWPWPPRSNLTWKAKFTPFWACPRHNSPSIQARTTKFWQKMQANMLVIRIVLGGDWLRASWSNLTR